MPVSLLTTTQIAPPTTTVTVDSAALPDGTVGVAYSAALSAFGGTGSYTWAATGTPAGLIVHANGQITGAPTGSAFYSFTVTATDSANQVSPAATVFLTVWVATTTPSPVYLASPLSPFPAGVTGQPYVGFTFTGAGGTAPYTFTTSSGLPAGLSLNGTTGAVSGTPTGTVPTFFARAVDHNNVQADNQQLYLPLSATPQIVITLRPPALATQGQSYSGSFTVSGGTPPYNWGTTTGLPPGLSINATTGAITGTPSGSGTFRVNVGVSDSSSPALTVTNYTMMTVASTSQDWTRPTGVILQALPTQATVPPAYCAPLNGATDMTTAVGVTHMPSYDGLYSQGLLTANGNTFRIGWVRTTDGANAGTGDIARNLGGLGDARRVGMQLAAVQYPLSLKWQMGRAAGRYNLWMAWFAYVTVADPRTQFPLNIRDSHGVIATTHAPNGGNSYSSPTAFADAAGNSYTTSAAWASAGDGTHGGVALEITTTDTSNGNGGPMIYFDCRAPGAYTSSNFISWAALVYYVAAQYLGP